MTLNYFFVHYGNRQQRQFTLGENSMEMTIIIGMLGGLALFLYGIELTGSALQKLTGPRLETILKILTRKKSTGIFLGILLTLSLQSSSAAGVVLINLVNTGLITLQNSISIILGAGLGTTIVVQIIAFKVTKFALLFVAGGFLLKSIARKTALKNTGKLIIGFGLIFYGMHLMGDGATPLRHYPGVKDLFTSLSTHPALLILLATAFTAIIQASAATISLAITLGLNGILPIEGIIPVVLGANLGTTITAILASLGSTQQGKQVALAHVLVKLGGILIFFPFMASFAHAATTFTGWFGSQDLARNTANIHLLFNAGIMLIFLPLTTLLTKLILKLIPLQQHSVQVKYLQKSLLANSSLALVATREETGRLSHQVSTLLKAMEDIISSDSRSPEDILPLHEKAIKDLGEEIKLYLAQIPEQQLNPSEVRAKFKLFRLSHRFEQIADTVIRIQAPVIMAKHEQGLSFSLEGGAEIRLLYKKVILLYEQLSSAVTNAPDSREHEQIIHTILLTSKDIEKSAGHHLKRFQTGLNDTIISSSIHLDIIYSLRTILDHMKVCMLLLDAIHHSKE